MAELISVIVPIYKVEPYLRLCVDSILAQTYSNLEIILVDDGSPDSCGVMCDSYAAKDRRVKVIHKENGGISSARNSGIDIACGEYLAFIDSDDWVHKKYIETLYDLLTSKQADFSVCNFTKVYNEDVPDMDGITGHVFEYTSREAQEQLAGTLQVQLVTAWGKLFRRQLFDEIRFPVGKNHEDEYVAHKLIYKAEKIVYTSQILLYYRQYADSFMSNSLNVKTMLNKTEALRDRAELYDRIGLHELRDRIYKRLFSIGLQIARSIRETGMMEMQSSFGRQFKELRFPLRKSSQTLKFRVFYELYFVFPRPMDFIQRINHERNRD